MSRHSGGSVFDVLSYTFPAKLMAVILLITSGLVSSLGCRGVSCGTRWHEPQYAIAELRQHGMRLSAVEHLYARARALEAEGNSGSVDAYFQVAALTCVSGISGDARDRRTIELHRSSLAKLVVVGQRFGRLNPASGMTLETCHGSKFIPLEKTGFVWQAADFQNLVPVGTYSTDVLNKAYCSDGIGVPLVVLRHACRNERFMRKTSAFSATLIMRNTAGCDMNDCFRQDAGDLSAAKLPKLELVNSRKLRHVQMGEQTKRLARDLSAPLVYRLSTTPRNYWQEFVRPDSGLSEGQLQMLEPYQPGKIPVVFIHGLLSDPYTWSQMINELMARPDFVARYQVWVYNYPTGRAFISSATKLRFDLEKLRHFLDPGRVDPALSQIVLVGHSLGGILAKLQVTAAQDQLWNSVANRPLDELNLPEQFREELRQYFYFSPSPDVKRVVYMGTPHRGSAYAKRCVGRLTSKLVRRPAWEQNRHKKMLDANPGVFSDEVRGRIPTSIDLLDPDSQLLQAIEELQVSPDVRLHSVIGDYSWRIGFGRSDLVVPVQSAREPAAVSELVIKAKHQNVNKELVVVRELLCILNRHAVRAGKFSSHLPTQQNRCLSDPDVMNSADPSINPKLSTLASPIGIMQQLADRTRFNAAESEGEQEEADPSPIPTIDALEVDFIPETSLQSITRPKSTKNQPVAVFQRTNPPLVLEQGAVKPEQEQADSGLETVTQLQDTAVSRDLQ
ncbi:MAG: esterase/lipase family protein [Rubripirellula sp.]